MIAHPVPITFFDSLPLQSISCGAHHTVALTKDGRLYTWGEACYGKLGNGDGSVKAILQSPTLEGFVQIPEERKLSTEGQIIHIQAGTGHTGVLIKRM